MCQISVENLHDELLNKMMFLIAGSFGSTIHDDGWGITSSTSPVTKSALPMFCVLNSGNTIRSCEMEGDILLGHIRAASPQVPVTKENSHPFELGGIKFVHNGRLVPKEEKNFIMEVEVQSRDSKTGELETNKDGTPKMTKIKRSDSLIFFEKFMEIWKNTDVKNQDTKFVTVLKDTMALFTGKFAMVFIIKHTTYIVRGRTADLHISYWKEAQEDDSKVLGWAINTDSKTLDWSTNLLSNLSQLYGGEIMWFTTPTILEAESIFKAGDFGLEKIGEVKEETAVVTYGPFRREWAERGENFQRGKNNSTTDSSPDELEKFFHEIYDFMTSHLLYPSDIQNLFWATYLASISEATVDMIRDFCKVVIPDLRKMTTKEIRKELKKQTGKVPVGLACYDSSTEYPWMFNTKSNQEKLAKKLNPIQ